MALASRNKRRRVPAGRCRCCGRRCRFRFGCQLRGGMSLSAPSPRGHRRWLGAKKHVSDRGVARHELNVGSRHATCSGSLRARAGGGLAAVIRRNGSREQAQRDGCRKRHRERGRSNGCGTRRKRDSARCRCIFGRRVCRCQCSRRRRRAGATWRRWRLRGGQHRCRCSMRYRLR